MLHPEVLGREVGGDKGTETKPRWGHWVTHRYACRGHGLANRCHPVKGRTVAHDEPRSGNLPVVTCGRHCARCLYKYVNVAHGKATMCRATAMTARAAAWRWCGPQHCTCGCSATTHDPPSGCAYVPATCTHKRTRIAEVATKGYNPHSTGAVNLQHMMQQQPHQNNGGNTCLTHTQTTPSHTNQRTPNTLTEGNKHTHSRTPTNKLM